MPVSPRGAAWTLRRTTVILVQRPISAFVERSQQPPEWALFTLSPHRRSWHSHTTPPSCNVLRSAPVLKIPSEAATGIKADSHTLVYQTERGPQFIDITDRVADLVEESGIETGFAVVFSKHTT